MIELLQRTVDGLMNGGAYALVGLGLAVTFGSFKRLNLAYGAGAMLAAYVGAWIYAKHGVPVFVVAIVVVATAALIGWYVERLCFAHSQDEVGSLRGGLPVAGVDGREVVALASSFAIWMQLEQLAVNLLPRHLNPFPSLAASEDWLISDLVIRPDRFVLTVLAVGLALGVAWWIENTRAGLAWRAASDHRTAAHLVGIPVPRLQTLTFVLASVLSGVAAFAVLALDGQVTPMFGMWVLLKGLVAAVIGGLGSVRGVLWGGLLLGVVEAHSQSWWGSQGREFTSYALLFIVLVRPWRSLSFSAASEAPRSKPA